MTGVNTATEEGFSIELAAPIQGRGAASPGESSPLILVPGGWVVSCCHLAADDTTVESSTLDKVGQAL